MNKKIDNLAADNIRALAISMVEKANSGHPGGEWEVPISYTFFIQNI